MVDQAVRLVAQWLAWLLAAVLGVFALVDHAMRRLMAQLHIAPGLQTIIMVLLTVALIIAALRLFGGVFRLLLLLLLILLLARVVFG